MIQEKPASYTLEQFRARLESEAMKRCERQEETIKKLHEQNANLESQNHSLRVNEKAYEREINRLRAKISLLENR